ncbi:MAG: diguanylate cyclase [Spirochaetes bacterium]|nr:diguanylate cyclase [Spirochaetota bacterium]
MQKVLIIEDSKLVCSIVKNKIESALQFEAKCVTRFSEAKALIDEQGSDYLACLAGLYLADAQSGEIVDYIVSKNIPAIVFTGEMSDEIRDNIWSKKVVDYILKDNEQSLDYIVHIVKRIYLNKSTKVMVVDDSSSFNAKISDLLKVHKYQVLQAKGGQEALGILNENPDIKLIITDYNMPNMNGFQLINEIRNKYSKEQIAIIGMSGDNLLSAKFIKTGANDFLSKEFFTEEFYCRITQNIELLENIIEIKEASNKDYLTNLYNRRYLYNVGKNLLENSKRKNLTITVAMLDIDFFKKVNDAYGHDAGDIVLKTIGNILQRRFRSSDIVARIGGEEFCVIGSNMDHEKAKEIFESVRQTVESAEIKTGKNLIKTTVSIGICIKLMDSLEEMIKFADDMLYKAKENGRNRVIIG